MSQWESQTRKLNNHYQSSTKKTREEFSTSLPLSFNGVYFKNGDFGFFPSKMSEPGAVFHTVGTPGLTTRQDFGAIAWEVSGTLTAKRYETESEKKWVYVGYYPSETYELEYAPVSISQSDGNKTISSYRFRMQNNEPASVGERTSLTILEMNGEKGLIPTLSRWGCIYSVTDKDAEIPEIFRNFEDGGKCPDVLGEFGTAADIIQKTLPAEARSPMVSIPGTQYFNFTPYAPIGEICGTDMRGRTADSTEATAAVLTNPAFCSSTEIRPGGFICPASVCLGTVSREGAVSFLRGAQWYQFAPLAGVIASGGIYNKDGNGPAIASRTFAPASEIDGAYYFYWRKVKSFRVVDNFTFWEAE